MSKLVFTSYAHDNRDEYLDRFIAELAHEVRQNVAGMDPDNLVFIDRSGIRTGEDWVQKLSDAVSNCKISYRDLFTGVLGQPILWQRAEGISQPSR